MRMAGQFLPAYVNPGKGCAKAPQEYPDRPKGGVSHGPPLMASKYKA